MLGTKWFAWFHKMFYAFVRIHSDMVKWAGCAGDVCMRAAGMEMGVNVRGNNKFLCDRQDRHTATGRALLSVSLRQFGRTIFSFSFARSLARYATFLLRTRIHACISKTICSARISPAYAICILLLLTDLYFYFDEIRLWPRAKYAAPCAPEWLRHIQEGHGMRMHVWIEFCW